jgi:tRNA pseudouridine65 synthase
MKLKILQQSKEYLIVHKPSGFVTYADSRDQAAIDTKALLEKQLGRRVFPVHRIDKDTCGILAFAFTAGMAQTLTALFRTRTVKKQYLAVVHGLIPEKGVIDEPLEKNKEKVKEAAITDYVRVAFVEVEWEGEKRQYSLVKCDPRTGRYHQIRRHLRFLGHPIVGDPTYGNSWDAKEFLARFRVKRTLLSAVALAFPDRALEKMVRVTTKPDPDFQAVVKAFGWPEK